MGIELIVTIFLIGFIGSYISGMVGVGGAIINYPMLLYIPAILGLASFSAHEVAGITTIQVLAASFSGLWVYRKEGYLNKQLIIYIGISVLFGSFIGGFGSKLMTESSINFIYGILALLAAIMMFIPKKDIDNDNFKNITFNKWLASILALIVGIGAGIVGAGGAFLLVPIMLLVLKIPTRVTIASSLAITFLSSIGTSVGKVTTGQVEYFPALIIVVASLIAAPLGAMTGKKINTKVLQLILLIILISAAVKIWLDILI